MEKNYLKEAANPQQYDSGFLNYDGSSDSPARRFFQEHLQPHLAIKGKSVVDIGSGMGQLFPLLKELGASEVQGIEPSLKNIEVSHKVYPDINVFHGTLADFPEARQFSTATAIMVFEHIGNLLDAFAKINRILSKEGEFFLVVADKQYHLTPRFGYTIETEDVGDGAVVAKTLRPQGIGTLYDILRPIEQYIGAAENNGFLLEKHIALKPTKSHIEGDPKYLLFANSPICHLLIFKKSRP